MKIFSNPAFWTGAIESRRSCLNGNTYEHLAHSTAIARLERLKKLAEDRRPIESSLDFKEWLSHPT